MLAVILIVLNNAKKVKGLVFFLWNSKKRHCCAQIKLCIRACQNTSPLATHFWSSFHRVQHFNCPLPLQNVKYGVVNKHTTFNYLNLVFHSKYKVLTTTLVLKILLLLLYLPAVFHNEGIPLSFLLFLTIQERKWGGVPSGRRIMEQMSWPSFNYKRLHCRLAWGQNFYPLHSHQ